jgi:hypothetical protein
LALMCHGSQTRCQLSRSTTDTLKLCCVWQRRSAVVRSTSALPVIWCHRGWQRPALHGRHSRRWHSMGPCWPGSRAPFLWVHQIGIQPPKEGSRAYATRPALPPGTHLGEQRPVLLDVWCTPPPAPLRFGQLLRGLGVQMTASSRQVGAGMHLCCSDRGRGRQQLNCCASACSIDGAAAQAACKCLVSLPGVPAAGRVR